MLRGLGVGHQAAVAPAVVMLSAVVEPGAEAQLLIVTGEPGPGLFKMFSSCYKNISALFTTSPPGRHALELELHVGVSQLEADGAGGGGLQVQGHGPGPRGHGGLEVVL